MGFNPENAYEEYKDDAAGEIHHKVEEGIEQAVLYILPTFY